MIIILWLLMTVECFAGMDFTGLGGQDKAMVVPHFFSQEQAIKFAIDVR